MSDSKQVRLNELARELEIKAKVLIDYLPEIGVQEKKTHSSSIDIEHAELARKHFLGVAAAEVAAEAANTCSGTGSRGSRAETCWPGTSVYAHGSCGPGCSLAGPGGNDRSAGRCSPRWRTSARRVSSARDAVVNRTSDSTSYSSETGSEPDNGGSEAWCGACAASGGCQSSRNDSGYFDRNSGRAASGRRAANRPKISCASWTVRPLPKSSRCSSGNAACSCSGSSPA
jgi:hypothetical protein